jgi:hypothetical protein
MERRYNMAYGIGNPYGAVPEALKEVRLSMSDILGNIIKGRELERQTNQDLAQAELKGKEIEAGVEKFKIENDLATATFKANRDHQKWMQDYETVKLEADSYFKQKEVDYKNILAQNDTIKTRLEEEKNPAQIAALKAQAGASNAAAAKSKFDITPQPIGNLLGPFASIVKNSLGDLFDEKAKIAPATFEKFAPAITDVIKSDNIIRYTMQGHKLIEEAQQLAEQAKSATGAERDALKKQAEAKIAQFNIVDTYKAASMDATFLSKANMAKLRSDYDSAAMMDENLKAKGFEGYLAEMVDASSKATSNIVKFKTNVEKVNTILRDMGISKAQPSGTKPATTGGKGVGTPTTEPKEITFNVDGQDITVPRADYSGKGNWRLGAEGVGKFLAEPFTSDKTGVSANTGEKTSTKVNTPPIEGAQRGKDGNWYVPDPNRKGKFLKVE